ncbi:MAG: rhomboid family intramembrane serine protease [Sedimentisphaerales bacterium]|nr:rhomboid family intramembrane serine protease [Sedimentisphaerales bacterium]
MLIPYQVDVPTDRWSISNYLIVGTAVLVFIFQVSEPNSAKGYILDGWKADGLFGHMWLHAGIVHLVGNMIFLCVLGNAVCYKTGNLLYPIFYILLGIAAATAHILFCGGRALGASGAINGIIGMYLVFFPLNSITCIVLWYPYIRTYSLDSFWVILLWCGYDIWGIASGGGRVAYFAHLGGFAGGFILAILLLKLHIVRMNEMEKSLVDIWEKRYGKPVVEKEDDTKEPPPYKPFTENGCVIENVETRAHENNDVGLDEYEKDEDGWIHIPLPENLHSPSPPPETQEQFLYFHCSCGKRIKVRAEHAGKTGRCPQCSNIVRIPKI